MDVALLKERFAAIPQETVDVAVSSINAYRDFIGNGVAVGKLAEPIVAKLLSAPADGFHAFPFVFTGKNPPFDVMLYQAAVEIPRERFAEVRKLYSSNFPAFHDAISKIVGGGRWCGISIKNYLNEEAQISTHYGIRDLCEAKLGSKITVHADAKTVREAYAAVAGQLGHEAILFLNSFPKIAAYQFALFAPDEMRITEIEFKKLAKHSRYVFRQDGSAVFHVKYGKNQANPYQRGLWVDDLSKLPILRKGKYRQTDFGAYILAGAFRIHPPSHPA